MGRISRYIISGALTLAIVSPSMAWAAPKVPPTPQQMDEAHRRYERALELSDEGNYDDALLELRRAYALAPTYRLLYNLGVVSDAVHDYVHAIEYFNRYLIEGGTEIEPARVAEVQAQIDRLRTRVASLRIYASVPSAQVSVDDVSVGQSPIDKPITINPGRHRVTASAPGYFPATSVIELTGNDSKAISLTLQVVSAEKPSRPIPWLGWGITAGLGAASVVTGVLALNAASSYDSDVNKLGVSASDVKSSFDKMRALSITTDVLIVGTVIAAGVSFYLTIKPVKTKPQTSGIRIAPNGFVF